RAFPDLQIRGEPLIQDAQVALVWTLRGTHQGPFLRIPPSCRAIAVRGVTLLMVRDGRIIQGDSIWDVPGFLLTIGLLPGLWTPGNACTSASGVLLIEWHK